MPVQVPMYNVRFPQYGRGQIVQLPTPDLSGAIAQGVGLGERLRGNRVAETRQAEQDVLAEEIARAELALAGRRADISERGIAQRETEASATERYQQGRLKMQMLQSLMEQSADPITGQVAPQQIQQIVDMINRQFPPLTGQPAAAAGAGAARPSAEPAHYEPEPAQLPYGTRTGRPGVTPETSGAARFRRAQPSTGAGTGETRQPQMRTDTPPEIRQLVKDALALDIPVEEIYADPEVAPYVIRKR